jgi:hypothetical protein
MANSARQLVVSSPGLRQKREQVVAVSRRLTRFLERLAIQRGHAAEEFGVPKLQTPPSELTNQ